MNWNLVAWCFGTVATFYAIKFIFVLFKSVFNKDTIVNIVDGIGDAAKKTSNKITNKLEKKVNAYRQQKVERPQIIRR